MTDPTPTPNPVLAFAHPAPTTTTSSSSSSPIPDAITKNPCKSQRRFGIYWLVMIEIANNPNTDLATFRGTIPADRQHLRNVLSVTAALLRAGVEVFTRVTAKWDIKNIGTVKPDFMKEGENVDRLVQLVYEHIGRGFDTVTRWDVHRVFIPTVEREMQQGKGRKAEIGGGVVGESSKSIGCAQCRAEKG